MTEQWTWKDTARIVAGHYAFNLWYLIWYAIRFVTFQRVHMIDVRWAWHFWIYLASHAYLYDDWKRGDMPVKGDGPGMWR